MSPFVARNGHGGAVTACPLLRDERKSWRLPGLALTSPLQEGQTTHHAPVKGKTLSPSQGFRFDKSKYARARAFYRYRVSVALANLPPGDLGNRLLSVLISLSHPQISGSLFTHFRRTCAGTENAQSDLTGKVKTQMRLRELAALLSSCNEQQDRIRCVPWNDRSHVAPSDDAGRRLAGSRQAQRLGSAAERKVHSSHGSGSRRGC
jgi:hypothetical protein